MPKAIPIILQTKSFPSKTAAKNFFRAMRDRYRDCETVNLEDSKLLLELLELHPDAEEKRGNGVERFYCGISDEGTRCFFIERTDGTHIDFSFQYGINEQ
jgi:hypothetical protein